MLRRPLALVLLTAHGAAAAHLALGAHVTADSGAVVDARPVCPQTHGSAGVAHGHELQRAETECEVVALARTGTHVSAAFVAVTPISPVASREARALPASPSLEVLSVAPKASPPV